jgi:hypothetical protein
VTLTALPDLGWIHQDGVTDQFGLLRARD